jgi:hypothetical protein
VKNAGAVAACVFMFFSIILGWQSLSLTFYMNFGPGPGFMPLWSSAIMFVLSAAYLWESIRRDVYLFKDILPSGIVFWKNATILGSVLLFMVIVPYTGFITASTLMLLAIFQFDFKWYTSLALALTVSAALFYIFDTLLKVPLPVNAFGW